MTDDTNDGREIITIDNNSPAQMPAVQQSVGALPIPKQQLIQQRQDMADYLREIMKQGTHWDYFGRGEDAEPSWLKPGVELLFNSFQLSPSFQLDNQSTDGEVTYLITCSAVFLPTMKIVGQGIGSCSSLEEKYAWRAAVCDEEFEIFPEHRRRVNFKTKWANGQPAGHWQNKQVRQDPMSQSNTILKMAKIRAQRDCAGNVLAVSDILKGFKADAPPQPGYNNRKPRTNQFPNRHQSVPPDLDQGGGGDPGKVTEGMMRNINSAIQRAGGPDLVPDLLKHLRVNSLQELTIDQVNSALDWLKNYQGES